MHNQASLETSALDISWGHQTHSGPRKAHGGWGQGRVSVKGVQLGLQDPITGRMSEVRGLGPQDVVLKAHPPRSCRKAEGLGRGWGKQAEPLVSAVGPVPGINSVCPVLATHLRGAVVFCTEVDAGSWMGVGEWGGGW